MTEPKPRRKRRTKANIVASIDNAAISEISKKGFVSSLVTNIIKEAQIEPQVFYNRYKDINEFYDTFVRRYDDRLHTMLEKIDDPLISKQGINELLKDLLNIINEDPVCLEILRWEVCENNKTTMRTALLREINFQPVVKGFTRYFGNSDIDIVGVLAILVGGIYYLSLHKKLAPFYNIDLNTTEGVERVEKVIERLISLIFDSSNYARREREIAERLRSCGVSDDVIAKVLGYNPFKPIANSKPTERRPSAFQ